MANRTIAPMTPRPVAAATLTPKEVLGILRRHVLLIVICTILGLITAGISWYLLSKFAPKYTAETFIKVLPAIEKDPMTIAGAQVAKDIQYDARSSLAALIKQQSTLQQLVARDKIQQTDWFKSFGTIKDKSIVKAVKDLRDSLGASAQRDGDYIMLSMTCSDKEEAALIVNEMLDLFLSTQGSTRREEVAQKLARLTDQRDRVQRDLADAEKSLDDVKRRYGFTDLGEHAWQSPITNKLNDLEIEQNKLVVDIKETQTNITNLRRQATGPVNEQVERFVEIDPTMVFLAETLASQESELAGLLAKFGENHQEVRRLQELIAETKLRRQMRQNEIAEQTRQSNLQNAMDQLVVLQGRLEQLESMRQATEAKNKDLDWARAQYEQRAVVRDERKQMLDEVKGQIEKLKIVHDDPETPRIQSMGYAPAPLEMSFPSAKVFFPGGTILGFMLGMGLAFLIELLNDTVRTPKDVARYLRAQLLGIIPDAAEDPLVADTDLCNVVRNVPYSVVSESYRQFKTNLRLSNNGMAKKILLISSCNAGDGKTSVAANLAATLVAENKKVLLIDANLWRPSLHKIFPISTPDGRAIENSPLGLSNLLRGQCTDSDVTRFGGIEGLYVIDAGPLPPNPAELLCNRRMEEFIKKQRDNYDNIIIDGLPVLVVSEAKVLSRFVDGTILVLNATTTRRGAAQRAIRELKEINAELTGCVLFNVRVLKGGYFHEQYRSYREFQKPLLTRAT